MNKLPNFLGVGAAKSGTSTLYIHLLNHPEIYVPKMEYKELRFFSDMGPFTGPGDETVNAKITNTLQEYASYYANVTQEKVIGDVSNDYLYFYEKSIKNIKKYLPGPTKIIILLRNPVDRAYSNYLYFLLDGRETLSFEEACKVEDKRLAQHWEWLWGYKQVGLYFKQVKAYLDNFDQVKVCFFDDLVRDNKKFLEEIYAFLEVDPIYAPKSLNQKFNASGIPQNKLLHSLLVRDDAQKNAIREFFKSLLPKKQRQTLKRHLMNRNLQKPPLHPETRSELTNYYREDVLQLQDLLQQDLSHWL
jgi:hypothetical protein